MPLPTYKFGDFEFDAARLALYHREELLKVEKKALQVLAVLIERPRMLAGTQEIIERIWQDNPLGVTSTHLAQSISKLRKILADRDPGVSYIETVKGRGYMFAHDVAQKDARTEAPPASTSNLPLHELATTGEGNVTDIPSIRAVRGYGRYGVAGGLVALLLALGWVYYPDNEQAEVQRVVKESQLYESLVLYRDPSAFRESDLDKYWTAETDPTSSYDRQHIRSGVRKLLEDGRQYGPESKNEQFEFQSIEISVDGQTAVVKTLEKWFVAEYKADGNLLKNKNVGPYFVSYVLRNIDGRWLIEKSTTARANSPVPTMEGVELVSEPAHGKEFFVRLRGSSFEPQTVVVKVIGPGCPETNPCTVPNSAIRIYSTISENLLERVPLTLASGSYTILLQNGDSSPSNHLELIVP